MVAPRSPHNHTVTYSKPTPGWVLDSSSRNHEMWISKRKRLAIMTSIEEHDGKLWRHCSISHHNRMPSYDEIAYMHRHWMGPTIPAIMIFPSEDNHVNTHKHCLHLFACLDAAGNGLPEFSSIIPGLGRQI